MGWSPKADSQKIHSPDAPGEPLVAPTVSVVIPAKNEEFNLPLVLSELPAWLHEVILVDAYSTDRTVEVARRLLPDIRIVTQSRSGKGNALACGFDAATGDYLVMLDADGSTNPAEIPRFIKALDDGADFAKGSRFLPGGGSADISLLRRVGNYWLHVLVNKRYGSHYTDLCYGYNAFRRGCLPVMNLHWQNPRIAGKTTMQWGEGFEVETVISVRIAMAGLRVTEVPSFERKRGFGRSNLNSFSDGLRVLRTIHVESKHPPLTRHARKEDVGLSIATPQPASPVAQAPVAQAPATQAPVTQAPVTQAPVTQAPVTQAPVRQVGDRRVGDRRGSAT